MITVTDLAVSFGRHRILSGVTFPARAGQITAIVGPNGSGKTTLLRAICGDLPSSGRIAINGHALSEMKPWVAASLRAVLPQAATLAFPFTVHEVVRLGLSAGRSGVEEARQEALPEEALALVDLEGFSARFYQELSGGEQQRVQLARVLCQVWEPVLDGEPRWLLLDEPVSSLDIRHQLLVMGIARRFADAGGGVVAVLHDLNLTAMFADAVAVMSRGRLAGFGPPGTIISDRMLADVFECALKVGVAPAGRAFVLPQTVQP